MRQNTLNNTIFSNSNSVLQRQAQVQIQRFERDKKTSAENQHIPSRSPAYLLELNRRQENMPLYNSFGKLAYRDHNKHNTNTTGVAIDSSNTSTTTDVTTGANTTNTATNAADTVERNPWVAVNGDLAETISISYSSDGNEGSFYLQKDFDTNDYAIVDENENPLISGKDNVIAYAKSLGKAFIYFDRYIDTYFSDRDSVQAAKDAWDAENGITTGGSDGGGGTGDGDGGGGEVDPAGCDPLYVFANDSVEEVFKKFETGVHTLDDDGAASMKIRELGRNDYYNGKTYRGDDIRYPYGDGYGDKNTIGYGHLITGEDRVNGININGSFVTDFATNGLSIEQCDALFRQDVQSAVNLVNARITTPLNQYQFDALVDTAYNCPSAFDTDSALVEAINSCSPNDFTSSEVKEKITNAFNLFIYAGNQVSEGLKNRRQEEITLFFWDPLSL